MNSLFTERGLTFSVRSSGDWTEILQAGLFLVGLSCLLAVATATLDSFLFQLNGRLLISRGAVQRATAAELDRSIETGSARRPEPIAAPAPQPSEGDVLGQIEIPRLDLSVVVAEGSSPAVLRRAVGHIPGTALPGRIGNAAIAGHRDTFFAGLEQIETGDLINIKTEEDVRRYRVDRVRIVAPTETSVLAPSKTPQLTLITCFPFNYLGPAPKRFVVKASEDKTNPALNSGVSTHK